MQFGVNQVPVGAPCGCHARDKLKSCSVRILFCQLKEPSTLIHWHFLLHLEFLLFANSKNHLI